MKSKPNVDEAARTAAKEIFDEWVRPHSQHIHLVTLLERAFYRGYDAGVREAQEFRQGSKTSTDAERK